MTPSALHAPTNPARLAEIFAHPNVTGSTDVRQVIEVPTHTMIVAQIYQHRLREHVNRAVSVAQIAGAEVFKSAGYSVHEETSAAGDRLAATTVVVQAPAFATDDEFVAAERQFYEVIDNHLPESLIPVVDIVLKP